MHWRDVLELYKNEEVGAFIDVPLHDIHQKDYFGDTPIILSCIRNDLEEARALLLGGANPNDIGEKGFTPLHYAVMRNNREMIKMLLDYGSNPLIVNSFGFRATDILT